jgi:hypothetical protein
MTRQHATVETRINMMQMMIVTQMMHPDQITANFLFASGMHFLSEPFNSSLELNLCAMEAQTTSNRNPAWEQHQAN